MYLSMCKCGQLFNTTKNVEHVPCYDCALAEICGDREPKEIERDAAATLSGTKFNKKWRWLQGESERPMRMPYENGTSTERLMCLNCGEYLDLCTCKHGN